MDSLYRIGIDTGGTFTDVCLVNENNGKITVTKIPSTPGNPDLAVIQGLKKIFKIEDISPANIRFLIHGTTVATNALLEHKGAEAALITTNGFEDVLHIGRQKRPDLYDSSVRRPPPLVPKNLRFGAVERILFDGTIHKKLNEEKTIEIINEIANQNINSIAVCLLHSYKNPVHEQKINKLIEKLLPQAYVTLSSEILPEFREYERISTVAVNAFVMPKVSRYIDKLESELKSLGTLSELYIMQSNSGVITAEAARKTSARTILSGPAGGVLKSLFISKIKKEYNIISIDMGGTSSDISLIANMQPKFTTESEIAGYPIKLPMADINTIGAGGGSIAWIDKGGALRVGPASAGAAPGPVCYNRGGSKPTVTDANVVLGRLNPDHFLNGEMEIYPDRAYRVIKEKIAEPLNMNVYKAAEGIITVVNANMQRGIRKVSVERGYDPRQFCLFSFGGAGPVHGAQLAEQLNMPKVIVPANPGIASAIGMLTADVRHDYVQTYLSEAGDTKAGVILTVFRSLEAEAVSQLRQEGFSKANIILERKVDLRYKGQAYELSVPVNCGNISQLDISNIRLEFDRKHSRIYGFERKEKEVEFVNIRVVALGKLPVLPSQHKECYHELNPRATEIRKVFFNGEFYNTPVYRREKFKYGNQIKGPAVIEQLDSTTVIFPGQVAETDFYDNIIINSIIRVKS